MGANYTVTGVGTTRTIAGTGAQTFSFGLTSGAAAVGIGYFFGWRDGDNVSTTGNLGVPEYDNSVAGSIRWFGDNVAPVVGSTPTSQDDFNRVYSLQANAVTSAAAPEPSALALLSLPLAGTVIRKRRSQGKA